MILKRKTKRYWDCEAKRYIYVSDEEYDKRRNARRHAAHERTKPAFVAPSGQFAIGDSLIDEGEERAEYNAWCSGELP